MTLLIACMLIYGFKLHWTLYVLATFMWTIKAFVLFMKEMNE